MLYRHTWSEVNLTTIGNNLRNTKEMIGKGKKILAVVKANAYGHGALEVARTFLEHGADYLGVATLDEAIELRLAGIDGNILVLGIIPVEYAFVAASYNIEITVDQIDWLVASKNYFDDLNRKLRVHLKVDTGMNRVGIQTFEELYELTNFLEDSLHFDLVGIFTHYASADDSSLEYTKMQQERFKLFVNKLKNVPATFLIHSCNSPAFLRKQYIDSSDNLFRLGITMYGYYPSEETKDCLPTWIKPALSLYSKINKVKKIAKGTYVGYGNSYRSICDEWVGTVPIGYADGLRRNYKNHEVLIDGVRCPIIGNVCMDQCMIRLHKPVAVGTLVVLIGESGNASITVEEIARKNNTPPHDVLCSISYRVPRIYIK